VERGGRGRGGSTGASETHAASASASASASAAAAAADSAEVDRDGSAAAPKHARATVDVDDARAHKRSRTVDNGDGDFYTVAAAVEATRAASVARDARDARARAVAFDPAAARALMASRATRGAHAARMLQTMDALATKQQKASVALAEIGRRTNEHQETVETALHARDSALAKVERVEMEHGECKKELLAIAEEHRILGEKYAANQLELKRLAGQLDDERDAAAEAARNAHATADASQSLHDEYERAQAEVLSARANTVKFVLDNFS